MGVPVPAADMLSSSRSMRSFISLAALFVKVMARILLNREDSSSSLAEKANRRYWRTSVYVLPEPAEARQMMKRLLSITKCKDTLFFLE